MTNIPGAYAYEGKSYGPFSATNKKGFVEVPAELAASLNLPLHESELDPAQDEIQPEGADIQELLDANHSLKADLDKANSELALLQDIRGGQGNIIQGYITEVADLKAKLDSTHEGAAQLGAARNAVQAELESTQSDFIRYQNDLPGLKARVAELEAGAAAEPESVLDASAPDDHGVAKPDAINPPPEASKPAKPAKGGAK
ncbi:hypothetical protein [Deinococcus rubellus]|uniref:Uncharacterized protein n=1 Tax=Deinococcus rubellus TaxID=1889240 RepID=A0ABY5YCJ7_9DEIO|nr:hypothetical protein [Deinococcus rubellus]UWX62777.1 hypothetical protein N0D28_08320 [Deinococcus rubellus]